MKNNIPQRRVIGIDARFYGPLGKGLGRYTQEIVDQVIALSADEPVDYVIFLAPENFAEFSCPNEHVRKELIRARWYTLAEQFEVPYKWWKLKIDLMHFPHFNVPLIKMGPYVVTIHDLILTKFPTPRASTLHPLIYRLKDRAYRIIISSAIKKARRIITVSYFTKNDLIQQFGAKASKISVTYEGVADLSKKKMTVGEPDKSIVSGLRPPFLLYVGNAYPHKNLESLVECFRGLRENRPDLRLVLVGKADYFYERLKRLAEADKLWRERDSQSPIIFAGYVPDAELETLFQKATVYVFPSLYEGFGLPPLEAMAHGCPVASSDKASMPEILGDAAAYFDPEKPGDMAAVLNRLLDDQAERQNLMARGYEQVKKYSWSECANLTWQIYQEILKLKVSHVFPEK